MSNKRVRGVSIYRPVIYGNTTVLLTPEERAESDHTHRWTVGVRSPNSPAQPPKRGAADHIGGGDDISYFIKKVTFKLHESFPTPLRSIEKAPFEVTETGWGEFDILIKIFFVPEASEKPITFSHHLKLHPWPLPLSPDPLAPQPELQLSPIHSWQYEELVFSEPMEAFYELLLSHPPTPLPKANRFPRTLTSALGGGGNIGEFSLEMEAEEGGRLEAARREALEEIEGLRKRLIGDEKELAGLRKEVDDLTATQQAAAATADAGT